MVALAQRGHVVTLNDCEDGDNGSCLYVIHLVDLRNHCQRSVLRRCREFNRVGCILRDHAALSAFFAKSFILKRWAERFLGDRYIALEDWLKVAVVEDPCLEYVPELRSLLMSNYLDAQHAPKQNVSAIIDSGMRRVSSLKRVSSTYTVSSLASTSLPASLIDDLSEGILSLVDEEEF